MKSDPRSELFLSCDLVGSTSYKQKIAGWQDGFLAFYRQFSQKVGDVQGEMGTDLSFDLWKPVGDELIFTVRVREEHDVYWALRVWLESMLRYDATLAKDTTMSTKGGAFIATFLGLDSESAIPRNPQSETSDKPSVLLNDVALGGKRNHTKYLYDYFGPSIDTGFRITSGCTPRYFTLSVETAWAFLLAARDDKDLVNTDMEFLGTRALKGVSDGREYPLFAIDRRCSDDINAAIKAMSNNQLSPDAAEKLFRECTTSKGWISGIYLPDSGHAATKVPPLDSLAESRKIALDMTGAESKAPGDQEAGKVPPSEAPLG